MKTGLFFGSFNPIHNGHIAIAGYMLEFTDLEVVWFVVSPHNPLKEQSELAPDHHRLEMVRLAIEEFQPQISLCDIEMSLPRPSYTIDTLKVLKEKYPERDFTVLMGSDSMDCIEKWKDFSDLLHDNRIIVYPRPGSDIEAIKLNYNVEIVNSPLMEISSTFIRIAVKAGKRAHYFMPPMAYKYLIDNNIY
ncbi:MAG: nicotinate (nicotinamide) nucleotide adenylyltransferase [Tenuifilaceae bacterium]|nr:nicotinate (nicotinamide) nucleotide adenylyltransferase [Tenuifilaceae bacterium]